MSARTNARQAALETLMRCRRDGAWSGASLDGIIRKYDLDRRDAAFASRLVLSVLENAGYCDFLIGCYSKGKLEPQVRDILRLGTAQLLFLDRVPASAAVNESVSLCRQNRLQRAAGLVNAVLRKIADNRAALPEGSADVLEIPLKNEGRTFRMRIRNETGGEFRIVGGIELDMSVRRRTE